MLKLQGGGIPTFYIDDSLMDSKFDYDFTGKVDDGTKYYRGGHEYQRPYGWKRYAIKVLGRFESDKWLGEQGIRSRSSDGEWPVSYHGTGESATGSIAQDGYKLSKGKRFRYGKGIYSTPSITVGYGSLSVYLCVCVCVCVCLLDRNLKNARFSNKIEGTNRHESKLSSE